MFPEHRREEFVVSTDPARLDLAVIHHFLAEESYWAKGMTLETLQRAMAHSLCFGLYRGEQQIGFARVVTDYATYAYLSDVFVLAAYRGQGLGEWLLSCVLAHPDLKTLRRFGLTTRDAQELYRRLGWQPLRYPERHMERLPDDYYQVVP
jgi:GNAT superfamily N-acetyltransferase